MALGRTLSRSIAIAAALLASASGCRSAPTCPVDLRTDAGRALDDHRASRVRWRALKAEARVTQWGARGRMRGSVLMYLEQPDRVRFDVLTQLGPAAILTSDGEEFQLSDFKNSTFLHGPTCPKNIARLLGFAFEASEVLRVLTGDTPLIDDVQRSMECLGGMYVITLVDAERSRQVVAFSVEDADRAKPPDEQRLNLRRSTLLDSDGNRRWEATYDDYVDIDGERFPTRVRLIDEIHGFNTEVRVKSITLDPEIPAGAFEQTPAGGMLMKWASCS